MYYGAARSAPNTVEVLLATNLADGRAGVKPQYVYVNTMYRITREQNIGGVAMAFDVEAKGGGGRLPPDPDPKACTVLGMTH